jgi:hypothetical protein
MCWLSATFVLSNATVTAVYPKKKTAFKEKTFI